jgi:hypothetical protein
VKPLRKICRGNRKRIAQSFPARSARRSKQFCSDAGQEECLNYAVLAGPRRGTLITPRTYSSTQPKWNIVSRRTTLALSISTLLCLGVAVPGSARSHGWRRPDDGPGLHTARGPHGHRSRQSQDSSCSVNDPELLRHAWYLVHGSGTWLRLRVRVPHNFPRSVTWPDLSE